MKYGLLVNTRNTNLGDDIQSYAESCFLPRVDCILDRENLDTFKEGDGTEPVATIMGAWFMWHKYNWPPARQIVPLLVGYHHFNRPKDIMEAINFSLPIFSDNYEGVGKQWLIDNGPVGCRDNYTKRVLEKRGIESYFSGCLTLTLPKQPETADKGTYVTLVDLKPDVEEKVCGIIGDRYEIRKMSHSTENLFWSPWEERKARAIEYLTIYQNAKYVVTRRLHVALPCLAMGVPVLLIMGGKMNDPHRFDPYKSWLHFVNNKEFMENGYPDFDFENGTPNKPDYEETRAALIKTIEDFISYCEENKDKPLEFFDKCTYTEEELCSWRADFRKQMLKRVHNEGKTLFFAYRDLQKEQKLLQRQYRKLEKQKERLEKEYEKLQKRYETEVEREPFEALKTQIRRKRSKK